MTTKEQTDAYQTAYRIYLKAHRNNDPLSRGYNNLPNPADYGMGDKTGEWLAQRLRAEVEGELGKLR